MLPTVTGVATLTRDPEIKYPNNGKSITNLGLAFNESWKDQDGNKKEKTTFVDGAVFGNLGEKVANAFLKKGSKIYILGKLEFQQWVAQDGSKRSKHALTIESFEMLDKKPDEQNNQGQQNNQGYQNYQRYQDNQSYQNNQANQGGYR